jgi:hypothetical protein
MASILTTTFLMAVVADIQPVIAAEFNDVVRFPWLGVAFTLGAAATTLFQAKIHTYISTQSGNTCGPSSSLKPAAQYAGRQTTCRLSSSGV